MCITVGKLDIYVIGSVKKKTSNSRVVTALASVDVVVRMHWGFRAELPTENFDGSVRDHLPYIHL